MLNPALKQQQGSLPGISNPLPVTNRVADQSSEALQQARDKFAAKFQSELPKSVWEDLKRYASDAVSADRVKEIKLALLKALGLEASNIKGCSLVFDPESGSAIHPGNVIKMNLAAVSEYSNISFPVTINTSDGIIKVNGKEVDPSRIAPAVRDTRSDLLRGASASTKLAPLLTLLDSMNQMPYVGQVKDSDTLIVINAVPSFQSDILKSFRCWTGSSVAGGQGVLTSVTLNPPSRGPNGELIIEGKDHAGQALNIRVDPKTGVVTLNGKEVIKSPNPSSTPLITDITKSAADARSFRDVIGDLKARGVEFKVSKSLSLGQSDDPVRATDRLKLGDLFGDKDPVNGATTPRQMLLMLTQGLNVYATPGLHHEAVIDGSTGKLLKDEAKADPIDISPFALKSYPLSATTGVAEVWDYMKGGVKVFTFDLNDPKAQKGVVSDILKYINATYTANNYEKIFKEIPAKRMTSFALDAEVVKDQRSTFGELIKNNPNSYFTIQYNPAKLTQDFFTQGEDKLWGDMMKRKISITPESIKTLGDGGIHINGAIEYIQATFPFEPKKHTFTFDKDGQTLTMDGKQAQGEYSDKFGNKIFWNISCQKDEKGKIISAERSFSILPPDSLPSEAQPKTLLDAELRGIGTLSGISQLPYQKAGTSNNVSVFTDVPDLSISDPIVKAGAENFTSGMQNAEALFGFQKGSKVPNMIIRNSGDFNGYAKIQTVNAAIADVGFLLWEQRIGDDVANTGFHEAVHALDFQSDMKLSGGHFERTFDAIKKDPKRSLFLTEINESAFLEGIMLGGHAQDNTQELLASFMGSLTSKTWEETMKRQTPAFRKNYKDVLEALAKNVDELITSGFLSANAPIKTVINNKMDVLLKI